GSCSRRCASSAEAMRSSSSSRRCASSAEAIRSSSSSRRCASSADRVQCGMDIREATAADAGNLVAYLQELVAEPGISIPLAPDQVRTVEQERAVLEDFSQSPRALMLVALADGQLVGELSLRAISARPQIAHVATLG